MKKTPLIICVSFLLLSWKPPINLGKAAKGLKLVSSAAHKISEEEEYFIGRAVAANILSQYPLWKNSEVTRYLNLIGKTLVLKCARPEIFGGYHFSLLDSAEANAFSAPGGIIFLTRAIVSMAENEDEVAAIIAHEIQHVASKDPLRAIKSQRLKALGTFAAGEAIGSGNQALGIFQESVLDISGTLLQKGYSRGQEKNADLGALELLQAAGYDPQALLSMLQKVKVAEKKKAKIFSAHPAAGKRIAYVAKKIAAGGAPLNRSARFARFKQVISRCRN